MAVFGTPGEQRAKYLLNDVPASFQSHCLMDQLTFIALADWMMENVETNLAPGVTIEESLFVFLDIAAQGNSFKTASYTWNHDVKETQSIFLTVFNALQLLREKEEFSPSCPPLNLRKNRWGVIKGIRRGKSRPDGMLKVGDQEGDGLSVSQEGLIQALEALNNFIHEHREQ